MTEAELTHKKRRYVWLAIFFILIAAVGGYIYYATGQNPQPSAKGGGRHGGGAGSTPVTVISIGKGDIEIVRRELGTVTPLANVTVRTQINGQLMEIAFQEGQIVQKGDYLAQIDPRPYQTTLEQAVGALQRDQALLKDAELNLSRFRKLVAENSLARQQADTQAALVDQYRGNIVTDQGQIDAAKLNLTYCHIVAPVTGRVGLRQVDVGNYAQTSDANGLVTLTQLQPISVIFSLPEDDLPAVMARLNDKAELPVTALDRTQSKKLAVGKLVSVDNQIDTATGTVKIRAQFDNQDDMLFPNQFVNADLLIDTVKDAVVAPTAAILRGTPGTFVYKIADDDTVHITVVKLGPTQGDNVVITDGLSVGDRVVIEGTDKLKDGAKVTIPADKKTRDADKSGDASPAPSDGAAKPGDTSNGKTHHHKHDQ